MDGWIQTRCRSDHKAVPTQAAGWTQSLWPWAVRPRPKDLSQHTESAGGMCHVEVEKAFAPPTAPFLLTSKMLRSWHAAAPISAFFPAYAPTDIQLPPASCREEQGNIKAPSC